jgi:ATP-dependent DNA helicase RecG
MTPDRLEELIAAGETPDVEFKGDSARPLSDFDLVESVVCLANRPGNEPGWLLIGVEDDGRISGARARHETGTDPARLQALVANRTRPSLTPRVEVFDLAGRTVIVVEVPPVRSPVGTTDGKYVRRAVGGDGRPACVPFMFHEMQAHQADRGALDYSALTLPGVRWDDLDPLNASAARFARAEGAVMNHCSRCRTSSWPRHSARSKPITKFG